MVKIQVFFKLQQIGSCSINNSINDDRDNNTTVNNDDNNDNNDGLCFPKKLIKCDRYCTYDKF